MFFFWKHNSSYCHKNQYIKCVCKSSTTMSVQTDLDKIMPLTVKVNIYDSETVPEMKETYYFQHKMLIIQTKPLVPKPTFPFILDPKF